MLSLPHGNAHQGLCYRVDKQVSDPCHQHCYAFLKCAAKFFDGENIDGHHLRPPVLAILLETIEQEKFYGLLV